MLVVLSGAAAVRAVEVTPGERRMGTILAGAGVLGFALLRPPGEPRWRGGVAFDPFGESLRVADPARSRTQRRVSDVGLLALTAAGVGSSIGKNAAVGWRAAYAYGATATATVLTKAISGRERPYGAQCEGGNALGMGCESRERYASFFSGHAAFAAASAGLICLNYASAACAAGVSATVAVAALRVSGSMHWLTDVAVGTAVGFVAGFVLPRHVGTSPREAARGTAVVGFSAPVLFF